MNRFLGILGIFLVLFAAAVLLGALVTQWVWAWVIPDVFELMVKADLLPATLGYWQAAKLNVLLFLLFGGQQVGGSKSSN